jgi:hypothetical protein
MSDQTPPPDLQAVEADLRTAHEQVRRVRSILAEALAEDQRLAGEQGGDER